MRASFQDCFVSWSSDRLLVGNRGVERAWSLACGAPVCVHLLDRARGVQWQAPAPFRDAFLRGDLPLRGRPRVAVEAGADDAGGTSEPHFLVRVCLGWPGVSAVWEHAVWPGLPVIVSRIFWERTGTRPVGAELERFFDDGCRHALPADDRLDYFGLGPFHLRYRCLAFLEQTDHRNNLVTERAGLTYPKEHLRLGGNFLHLSCLVGKGGLLALKFGPSPHPEAGGSPLDFLVSGQALAIVGSGILRADLSQGRRVPAHASAVGVSDGKDTTAERLCHALMRRRWKPDPARDFSVLANTWGDRMGASPVGERMVAAEIRGAARLGLSHCQVDAGWHLGTFDSLDVASRRPRGAYAIDPRFWEVHPGRFPRGFGPVAELARREGVRLGLWFAPDATAGYAAWRKDAGRLIGLARAHGFDNIKIDGVSIRSKRAEENLARFLRALRGGGPRGICVNLDLTAGLRAGSFYLGELAGNLFLENRYMAERTYFPHWTLRNLWLLSRCLPTYKFQVETVNTALHRARYGCDPLAPSAFGNEYAFAVTMMANPLFWMETARLSAAEARRLGAQVRAYRPHQAAMLLGDVRPIGEEPSGRSWTGFQSATGPGSGYLLVFREFTPRPAGSFGLHGIMPGTLLALRPIAGENPGRRLQVDGEGTVCIHLPRPRSFSLMLYRTQPDTP